MIVDAVLGAFHGLCVWLVGLLPEWSPLSELYVANLPGQGGSFQFGGEGVLTQILITANYFLPLMEGFTMIGLYMAVLGIWAGIRFVMRLIPGLN